MTALLLILLIFVPIAQGLLLGFVIAAAIWALSSVVRSLGP
jgi:hypothetical protein